MGTDLVRIVFTLIAVSAAFMLTPRDHKAMSVMPLALWVVAAAIAFMINSEAVAFGLLFIILGVVAPINPVKRVYFYIAGFAALPYYFDYNVPFPGINYLININFAMIATIAVLGPVFVGALRKPQKELRGIDFLVLVFALLTGAMTARDDPFTTILRMMVDQTLLVYIPYLAISRTLTTRDEVKGAVIALFVGVLVQAFIGILSAGKFWNYYAGLGDDIRSKVFRESRNGILRVYGTLAPAPFGMLMAMGLAITLWLRSIKALPALYILIAGGAIGVALIATGTRGAWLTGILSVVAYLYFLRANRGGRRLFVLGLVTGLIAVFFVILSPNAQLDDAYGTFEYRAELLRVSLIQIADEPWFGSSDFLESERFAHLMQGEGIIDIVNTYLQLALYYGLVGLSLFVAFQLMALRATLKAFRDIEGASRSDEDVLDMKRLLSLLVAMQLAILFMIATVSAISYTYHYVYISLAFLVAQNRISARFLASVPVAEIATTSEPVGDQPQRKPKAQITGAAEIAGPKPYGARFVHRSEA